MRRLDREDGGIIAKLIGLALVGELILSTAMYLYGKRQQPLSIEGVHIGASAGSADAATVVVSKNGRVYVATVVHNDGKLPITLQGLADEAPPPDQPLRAISLALGDGKTTQPAASATFTPVGLDPGEGVGVFVVFAANPGLACDRLGDTRGAPTPFPAIPLRLTSYGVETTQSIALGKNAPDVRGLTRAECMRAVEG